MVSGETIRDDESVRPPNGVTASELDGGGGRKSEPQSHPLPPASLPLARSEPADLLRTNTNPNQTSRMTPGGDLAAQRATPGDSGDRDRLDLQLQEQAASRNKEHSQARSLLDGLSVITEATSGAAAAHNGNGGELRSTPPEEDEVPVPNLVPPRTSKRLRSADPHNKPRNEEDEPGPDGGPAAQNGFSNGHSYSPLKATGGGLQLLLPPPPPTLAGRMDPSHILSQGPSKPTLHAAHSYQNVNGASPNSDASNPKTERSEGKLDMPPMSLRISNLALFASSSDKASNLTSTSYSHLPPAGATPYALLEDSTTL